MPLPSGSSYNPNNFEYIYQYKDHLGNVRVSYREASSGNLEIIEENHYYAFGLQHKGYNSAVLTTGSSQAQKYKYNGKELQDELNLGWYDYQARNYDPALGRWFNIDPLAETSRRFSPYTYALNNPVFFIDPDGMEAEAAIDVESEMEVGEGVGYFNEFSAWNKSITKGKLPIKSGKDKDKIDQHIKDYKMVRDDNYTDREVLDAGALYDNKNVKNVKSGTVFTFTTDEAVENFKKQSKFINAATDAVSALIVAIATKDMSKGAGILPEIMGSSLGLAAALQKANIEVGINTTITFSSKASLNLSTISDYSKLVITNSIVVTNMPNGKNYTKTWTNIETFSNTSEWDINLMKTIMKMPNTFSRVNNPIATPLVKED